MFLKPKILYKKKFKKAPLTPVHRIAARFLFFFAQHKKFPHLYWVQRLALFFFFFYRVFQLFCFATKHVFAGCFCTYHRGWWAISAHKAGAGVHRFKIPPLLTAVLLGQVRVILIGQRQQRATLYSILEVLQKEVGEEHEYQFITSRDRHAMRGHWQLCIHRGKYNGDGGGGIGTKE